MDETPPPETDSLDLVSTEIRAALDADASLLGEVYRALEAGLSADQIREARGNALPNFVWNYRTTIKALVDGTLPIAPTVALQTARAFRRILKDNRFSASTRGVLEERLAVLESRAADPEAQADEDKKALAATRQAELHAIPGIYVYALPHYLRYPYDEESGRTLLKVGHTSSSVIQRFNSQKRETVLPEDPVLLRVYPTSSTNSHGVEQSFHALLDSADHVRSRGRSVGREWFLTSTKFLDQIAITLGLRVVDVYDPDGADGP